MIDNSYPCTAVDYQHVPRMSVIDIADAYGIDAVTQRITALRAAGYHYAATAIERELPELQSRRCRTA